MDKTGFLYKELSSQARPILVSACLLGKDCAWDGSSRLNHSIKKFFIQHPALALCPEEEGGMDIPHAPCEIKGGSGEEVVAGKARVITKDGLDFTIQFLRGADKVLKEVKKSGCLYAVMKSDSPSCGRGGIYDGSFTHTLREGNGVTAALLLMHGLTVITEQEFENMVNED